MDGRTATPGLRRATTAIFPARWLVPLALILLASSPVAGQRLPLGAHHSVRERSYDLQHLKAHLGFDFAEHRLQAKVDLTLSLLRPLSSLELDARGLAVESVHLADSGEGLAFAVEKDSLRIELPPEVPAGEPVTFSVEYTATPRAGLYFQPDHDDPSEFFVHTYGEGGLHSNWLPLYNDVNDKFTSEMVLSVPKPYVAISNGRLVDSSEEADGASTWHWRQEKPHSNYLISIYVGDFERGELAAAHGEIPLAYWVPRGRLQEGAHAFRNTTRMVEFYSRRFSYRYPWSKYDQIAVPDYAIGAMEHTGVTGHRASVLRPPGEAAPLDFGSPTFDEYSTDWTAEATISHELAHHWFGDAVTCRSLGHLWLNESFASYLMMLWDEESVGRDQLLFDVELARRHYFEYVDREHVIRPLEYHWFDDPNTIYNTEHTYLKGAAFLHMLRSVVGDDDFFRTLGQYLRRHEGGNVESQDLSSAFKDFAGLDLDWLFADWVTGGGHPVLEIGSRWLADRGVVDLEVRQVQPIVEGQGLFRLPATVTVVTPAGSRVERIWVEEESGHWLLPAAERPRMVSFDGAGELIAEIRFEKDLAELIYQSRHDELPGRFRAMRQLARRFPTRPATVELLDAIASGNDFWALRAEAAELLGELRTPAAERAAGRALAAADYRVRKAAVLALRHFGTATAEQQLRELVRSDPSSDVVGTALVALARSHPDIDPKFFAAQLGRPAWHDEITLAALIALKEAGHREAKPLVVPYVEPAYNQDVRQAAFEAWEAFDPTDTELHRKLLAAAGLPPYALQQFALEALGRLYVEEALPLMEDLVTADVDPNLTALAGAAAAEIRRIAGAGS